MTPEAKKAGGVGPDDVIMRVLDMVDGQLAAEPEAEVPDEMPEDEEGVTKPGAGLRVKVGDALKAKGMDEEGIKEIMDMMPEEIEDADPEKKVEGEDEESEEEKKKKAEDEEKAKGKETMDAAIKAATKQAEDNTMKRLHEIRAAERAVMPLIGEISIAMDSAADIYRAALKAHDVDTKDVHESALPAMVAMLAKSKEGSTRAAHLHIVGDAAALEEDRAAFDKAHGITTRSPRNLGAA